MQIQIQHTSLPRNHQFSPCYLTTPVAKTHSKLADYPSPVLSIYLPHYILAHIPRKPLEPLEMDPWSWISELPNSDEWNSSDSPLVFQLASFNPGRDKRSTRSIQLRASNTGDPDSVTFSVSLVGFESADTEKSLWVSETCPLSSENPFLPLVLQILQDIVSRTPTAHDSTCLRSQLQQLKPEPVSWIMDSHSPESFSGFCNIIFIMRLFWLCVFDAPSEAGYLYFHHLLAPNLDSFTSKHGHILRTFFVSVGVDVELCFMRTLGYILAKWLILREVGVGLQTLTSVPSYNLGFSYAVESHGLWVLKGYSPVWGMRHGQVSGQKDPCSLAEPKEPILRYALAHQLLEALVQFEYTIKFTDGFILVNARVDNIRLHVSRLGFGRQEGCDYADERHFPSRIRVWVGPEVGSTFVGSLSLGRSTDNVEREIELQRVLKGSFGKRKAPKVKATARTATRTKTRNWRWDQDAEGNSAVFDAVLCDNTTGIEVATWKPPIGDGQHDGNNFETIQWRQQGFYKVRRVGICRGRMRRWGSVEAEQRDGRERAEVESRMPSLLDILAE